MIIINNVGSSDCDDEDDDNEDNDHIDDNDDGGTSNRIVSKPFTSIVTNNFNYVYE